MAAFSLCCGLKKPETVNFDRTWKEEEEEEEEEEWTRSGDSEMFEVGRRMTLLYICKDHVCRDCILSMSFIAKISNPLIGKFKYHTHPETVARRLLSLGFLELCQQIWRKHFREATTVKPNEKDSWVGRTSCLEAVQYSCWAVIGMSDASKEACEMIVVSKVYEDIVRLLKMDYLKFNLLKLEMQKCLMNDFVDDISNAFSRSQDRCLGPVKSDFMAQPQPRGLGSAKSDFMAQPQRRSLGPAKKDFMAQPQDRCLGPAKSDFMNTLKEDANKSSSQPSLSRPRDPQKDFKDREELNPCRTICTLLGIMHNVIQVVDVARQLYREMGIVDLLQELRSYAGQNVACLAVILLAWVIDDEESNLVNSDDKIFSFLKRELDSALAVASRRSENGFKSVEILTVINKLAVSDSNKKVIIQSNILPVFARFLEPSCDEEERVLAAQGIWSLAFTAADDIKKEKSCVEGLELIMKNAESHENVKVLASGALNTLGIGYSTGMVSGVDGASENDKKVSGHVPDKGHIIGNNLTRQIFISYNHGSKDVVFKIKNCLKEMGYTIWIDADQMCGSLAEDIIEGIDGASVVIVCLSQKYYESPYCKKEVIYSDDTKKELIPLTVEPKYQPQGWLKFRMADKLRIDFTRQESFEESLRTLFQRLKKIIVETDFSDGSEKTEPETSKPLSHVTGSVLTTTAPSVVHSFTAAEVGDWLTKHDLGHLKEWFDGYDGKMLLEYKSLSERAPESFAANFLKSFSAKDLLKLNIAMKEI